MKFVNTNKLTEGMRLAKPIYNKNGVLLYDRNTNLTAPGIKSIRNFGLIGIYILEPAEPLPPLTQEDLEFEQCSTIYMFQIRECFDLISKRKKIPGIDGLVKDIVKRFGSLDHRANFNQNMRSPDDFAYKHAISVSILCAMIANRVNLPIENTQSLVAAAILYGFGYQFVPHPILEKGDTLEKGELDIIQQNLEKGINYLEMYKDDFPFFPAAYSLMRYHVFQNSPAKKLPIRSSEEAIMEEILKVAISFDAKTSMKSDHDPESEIMAMQYLADNPDIFNQKIAQALAESIHIVPTGASVDLSTNDKGIVLAENPDDFMHPVILRLSDNQVYDLSLPTFASKIKILDIMKTMDNRIEIDEETVKQFAADERIIETTNRIKRDLARKQAEYDFRRNN